MAGRTNGAEGLTDEMAAGQRLVTVARIVGVFGVAGWVKIFSYTRPRENVLTYSPWYLQRGGRWEAVGLLEGRLQGKGVVARLQGVEDRDQAQALIDTDVAVRREQLPPSGENEFYWVDLLGLRVVNRDGVELGVVKQMMETGANDVLVVEGDRERLIPLVPKVYVLAVDLEAGRIDVDWPADY